MWFMSVWIKRPGWDTRRGPLHACRQWPSGLRGWVGQSIPRSCLHMVDTVARCDSTNTNRLYPNQTHRGVCLRSEPWPHSIRFRQWHAYDTGQNSPRPGLKTPAWPRDNCVVYIGRWWDERLVGPIEMPLASRWVWLRPSGIVSRAWGTWLEGGRAEWPPHTNDPTNDIIVPRACPRLWRLPCK